MNVKLKVLTAGALFFLGGQAVMAQQKKDEAKEKEIVQEKDEISLEEKPKGDIEHIAEEKKIEITKVLEEAYKKDLDKNIILGDKEKEEEERKRKKAEKLLKKIEEQEFEEQKLKKKGVVKKKATAL